MREIALHLLDIVQNSIRAEATLVEILIAENRCCDRLVIEVRDNGRGMSSEMVAKVLDPFITTRATRRVGLGLPLFAQAAERSGGRLVVSSQLGRGTDVFVVMQYSHIDRTPLGDISGTVAALICHNPAIDFVYHRVIDQHSFTVDSREVKQYLEDVSLSHPTIAAWLRDYVVEAEQHLQEVSVK